MSTFLELVQGLAYEVDAGSAPQSVVSQTGEALNYVRWVRQAWRDIQLRHRGRWKFLQRSFTFNTTASDGIYAYSDVTDVDAGTAISRFGSWWLNNEDDPPKIYLTSSGVGGQRWLTYIPWDYYKSIYRIGTQNNGPPVHITVDPQENIVLGPVPDAIYTVTGDFFRSAQMLTADADTPEIHSDYHDIIVFHAMEKYAYQQVSQENLARGRAEGRRLLRQMEARYMPDMGMAEPMA